MQEHICLLSSPVPSFGLGECIQSVQNTTRIHRSLFNTGSPHEFFMCYNVVIALNAMNLSMIIFNRLWKDLFTEQLKNSCRWSRTDHCGSYLLGSKMSTQGRLYCPCSREHLGGQPTILSETLLCGFELCEQKSSTELHALLPWCRAILYKQRGTCGAVYIFYLAARIKADGSVVLGHSTVWITSGTIQIHKQATCTAFKQTQENIAFSDEFKWKHL